VGKMSITFKKLVVVMGVVLCVGYSANISNEAFSMEFSKLDEVTVAGKLKLDDISTGPEKDRLSADNCLSLLKTAHYQHEQSRSMYGGNYDAAKATAVGLVFGVRFALGPKEVIKKKGKKSSSIGVWQLEDSQTGGYKALAVAEYRRCKNEEAIKSLSDWRWQR
jgi:hypothetical protein